MNHLARWLFATVLFVVFGLTNAFIFEALAQTNKPNTSFSSSPDDVENRVEPDEVILKSLFPFNPLGPIKNAWNKVRDPLRENFNLHLGMDLTTAYTKMSESLPGTEDEGMGYDYDFNFKWIALQAGKEWEGFVGGYLEIRTQAFTDASPGDLFLNAGSLTGPVDQFDSDQGPVLREFYWQQGSKDARFMYRVGKIIPDTVVGTVSQFDSASLDFMALSQVVKLSARFADPGIGGVVGFYPQGNSKHRPHIQLFASDQNGDRQDFGNIDELEFYKGVEVGFRPFPQTDNAPFWRFAAWHADEQTIEGLSEGYGVLAKIEQELTSDGRIIGVLNYGHSWKGALAENHATARLVVNEPFKNLSKKIDLTGDRLGFGFSWVDPDNLVARDEFNLEVFYRLPIIPLLDMTLDMQYMIDPALIPVAKAASPGTDTFDNVFAFSVRFRTEF